MAVNEASSSCDNIGSTCIVGTVDSCAKATTVEQDGNWHSWNGTWISKDSRCLVSDSMHRYKLDLFIFSFSVNSLCTCVLQVFSFICRLFITSAIPDLVDCM